MLIRRTFLLALLPALAGLSPAFGQRGEFKPLLTRIPSGVNAILAMDVAELHESPLALKENWKKRHNDAYSSEPMILPPDALRLVLAAQLDSDTLEPVWQVAMMELSAPPSMATLARAEGGKLDEVGGVQVVWSPYDVCFVKFSDQLLGTFSPAKHRYAARWIEGKSRWKGAPLPEYLKKAAHSVTTPGMQIVLAMDLEDVTDISRAQDRLAASSTMKGRDVDLRRLANVICSLKGLAMSIKIGEQPHATMKIDFGQDASIMADFAKPLIIEAFGGFGIYLKDFEGWKADVSGNTVTLSGTLSKSGLSLLFSLMEMPAPAHTSPPRSAEDIKREDLGAATSVAQASHEYFQSVDGLLQALYEHPRSALWMRKTSQRMARLPVLNVDQDLLGYTAQVADLLLQGADTTTGHRLEYEKQATEINPQSAYVEGGFVRGGRRGYGGGRRGGYGYAYRSSNYGERRRIRADQRAKAINSANEVFRELQNMTMQVRAQMADRYQIAF